MKGVLTKSLPYQEIAGHITIPTKLVYWKCNLYGHIYPLECMCHFAVGVL